ncbi:ribosome maturation factor RimM [Glycomyces sp. L485]|uniref:ribosome maturation factor RimM n=1 Tax=Glycomyces sp. L485 TaxID=2909235 RepID=UPI001F4AD604|nr:ribosome maturation factor RimM [Glycomyces sp. L485]MCH7231728.1 ribosome maturation factor RimM [Glycomyces sp. L485]
MEQVVVGRIVRPHGVRGEVVVEVRTDDPEVRFQPGAEYATSKGALRAETVRWHQGRPMLTLEGVNGREAAEALRGTELSVDIDPEEIEVDDEEFHDTQLVGLSVVAADGEVVGTVSRIDHGPAHETLVVKRRGTHPALIPFVEEMITEVDLDAEAITVDLPQGLLEL